MCRVGLWAGESWGLVGGQQLQNLDYGVSIYATVERQCRSLHELEG